jgi:ATP-dependent Clp protease ATP-binding subunit ClpX
VNANDTTTTYRCSFCGKPHPEVGRMIAEPGGVMICNEGVGLCNKIIEREGLRGERAKA